MDGWLGGWVVGWLDGWVVGWLGGWVGRRVGEWAVQQLGGGGRVGEWVGETSRLARRAYAHVRVEGNFVGQLQP